MKMRKLAVVFCLPLIAWAMECQGNMIAIADISGQIAVSDNDSPHQNYLLLQVADLPSNELPALGQAVPDDLVSGLELYSSDVGHTWTIADPSSLYSYETKIMTDGLNDTFVAEASAPIPDGDQNQLTELSESQAFISRPSDSVPDLNGNEIDSLQVQLMSYSESHVSSSGSGKANEEVYKYDVHILACYPCGTSGSGGTDSSPEPALGILPLAGLLLGLRIRRG
jgi:MYXO-CTERM domain-containing protein